MPGFQKSALSLFLAISFHFLQAQNIVPNGNLEDINICTEINAPCSPSAWFAVKQYTPGGYYHRYPEKAASGNQYFDLFVVLRPPQRQYWQTKLLCSLVAGQKYGASVKVAAGEIGPNINDIGFYFTNRFIYSKQDTLLQPANYLDFRDADIKKLKNNWFQLTKQFTADSNETCLIIGNFSSEDNRAILQKRQRGTYINIMIDDIVIQPVNGSSCPDSRQRKDSLYAYRKRHSGDSVIGSDKTVRETVPDDEKITDTPGAAIIQTEKTDTIQLNNVLFEFDKHILIHPDTIEAFRSVLTSPAVKSIQVVGYTDDAGSISYNTKLSERRAQEIARLISKRFKIPSAIIRSEGRGISVYHLEKSRNRRVDIYVHY